MALAIPIISTFDGDGVSKAIKEFKQLETSSEKAQFAIKKAAVPAAAALVGLGIALFDATKGAIEDAAAQDKLAEQIRRTTGATDAQIKANEDWISTQGKLLGVTDEELRPALGNLVRATGDITKAQELASAAMDISVAKNLSLETTTKALERAYGGNMTALAKLSPELRDMIKGGASLDDVMAKMSKTFGGAASAAAETTQGKFERLKIALDETKESIGASLMPAVEAVLPYLQNFAKWAQDNPQTFTIIAGALAAVAASIVAINIAMALNPIGLIVIAVGLAVAALAIAYTKFEGFRKIVDNIFEAIKWYVVNVAVPYFKMLGDIVMAVFDRIKIGWNNTIGGFSFKFPDWIKYTGVVGAALAGKGFTIPMIGGSGSSGGSGFTSTNQAESAMFGKGGSVSAAAPSTISSAPSISKGGGGSRNTDASVPYISMEDMAPHIVYNNPDSSNVLYGGLPNITLNIDTLFADPSEIGRQVVASLSAYQNRSGPLPLAIA